MLSYLSLKDHVYNYISDAIQQGTLKPNEKINEQKIIETLDISRTPVREALIELAAEGYLEKLPRKGFIVKPISTQKALEIYQVIGVLDGLAAQLACDFITDKHLNKMQKTAEKMDQSLDKRQYDKYYDLQIQFHEIYIELCGNEELIRQIHMIKRNFLRKTYVEVGNKDLRTVFKDTNQEHYKILELFQKKDKTGLDEYIKNIHWKPCYSHYDSLE